MPVTLLAVCSPQVWQAGVVEARCRQPLAYARLVRIKRRGGPGAARIPYGAFMEAPSAPHAGRDRVNLERTNLGPFQLVDAARSPLIAAVVDATEEVGKAGSPLVMLSLHVGGLNLRKDRRFISALCRADLVVADGISVAALAGIAGAHGLHRHPTTDLGWELLAAVSRRLGRPARVALLGGPAGLARRTGDVMSQHADIEVVLTEHGYQADWSQTLVRLAATAWDVLIVGMGMPSEALWVDNHRERLDGALVLTCGGWFGHIVGDERRAPAWMRHAGLEWAARLAQQPTRLFGRYARGLLSTAAMIPTALRSRRDNTKPAEHQKERREV